MRLQIFVLQFQLCLMLTTAKVHSVRGRARRKAARGRTFSLKTTKEPKGYALLRYNTKTPSTNTISTRKWKGTRVPSQTSFITKAKSSSPSPVPTPSTTPLSDSPYGSYATPSPTASATFFVTSTPTPLSAPEPSHSFPIPIPSEPTITETSPTGGTGGSDNLDVSFQNQTLVAEESKSPEQTVRLGLNPGKEGIVAGAVMGSFVVSTLIGFFVFRRREAKRECDESSQNYTEIASRSWNDLEGTDPSFGVHDSYMKDATTSGRRSMSELAIGATQEEFVQNGMRIDVYGSGKKKKKRNSKTEDKLKKGADLRTELDPINEVDSAISSSCATGVEEERRGVQTNMLPLLDYSSSPTDSDEYLATPSVSSNPSDENDEIFHHHNIDRIEKSGSSTEYDHNEPSYAQFTVHETGELSNSPILSLQNIALHGPSLGDGIDVKEDEPSVESVTEIQDKSDYEESHSPSVVVITNQQEIPDSPFMSTNPMVVIPVGDEHNSDDGQDESAKRKLSFTIDQ